ncbi:hypothetical protein WICPIJ_008806 [Wickerhamomyces pijperi]|uniref:Protein SCD5 n=1 Tax=Wickerhamomyces pijperi TaxID=599730 RepID=A0A9P8PWY9_WICPI|nr:hypothetical protein WICPIJ_008806 [Wickerhamomyces pijperi]
MNGNSTGFDWLNISGIKSDTNLPPPPVSFGVSPLPSKNASLTNLSQTNPTTNGVEPVEEYEDLIAPLSLTKAQLTPEESKTYLRWYNDMVVRKGSTMIKVADVFKFLKNNFKLPHTTILLLEKIFKDMVNLEMGGFFALLRLIAHVLLLGQIPRRRLTNIPAPILKPRSILASKKRVQNDEEQDNQDTTTDQVDSSKIDLDSFTQFMLTGERPSSAASNSGRLKKKTKRVKFSEELTSEPDNFNDDEQREPTTAAAASSSMDFSLPMDQLLQNLSSKQSTAQPSPAPPQIQISEDDKDELNEMKDSLNNFQNIRNVDSALIHGIPSQIPSIFFDEANKSGMVSPDVSALSPNTTGQLLAPNHTGPVPSMFNAYTQADNNNNLSPNFAGNDIEPQPLKPAMTGSLSGGLRQQFNMGAPALEQQHIIQNSLHVGGATSMNNSRTPSPLPPPPPPSRRMRSASTPSPLPHQHQAPPPPPPARGYGSPPPPTLPPKSTSSNNVMDYSNQFQHTYQPSQDYPAQQQQQHQPYSPEPSHQQHYVSPSEFYQTMTNGGLENPNGTGNILGDLKALQDEVERIRGYNG